MSTYEPLALDLVTQIVDESLRVLENIGVAVHHPEAVALLADHGARVNGQGRVLLPPDLVDRARRLAPASVRLCDLQGRQTHDIGGRHQSFAPGSSATALVDCSTGQARRPTTSDYVKYARIVSGLPHLAAQSTAFVPADVPAAVSDSYRLYLSLLHCEKPVITGAFSAAGFELMRELLLIIRGSEDALARQPLAIFSCCPTSPLAWSRDSLATLLGSARTGIPVEIVPMPLAGFIAPVSLAGTLVQQTAEALAGIVIGQLANPGAPVLFGGAGTIFDVRHETTPMACVESMLIACGAAQIGRRLELPTQAYIALSDAKTFGPQAGFETGLGAALGALAGINEVSGPGMLEFGNAFSLEKLVFDDEICGAAIRLRQGISPPPSSATASIEELLRDGHLLIAQDTRQHLREQISFPGVLIDRESRRRWAELGAPVFDDVISATIDRLVATYEEPPVGRERKQALSERMSAAMRECGVEALPDLCGC